MHNSKDLLHLLNKPLRILLNLSTYEGWGIQPYKLTTSNNLRWIGGRTNIIKSMRLWCQSLSKHMDGLTELCIWDISLGYWVWVTPVQKTWEGLVGTGGTPDRAVKSGLWDIYQVCILWVGQTFFAFNPVGMEVPVEFLRLLNLCPGMIKIASKPRVREDS